MAGIRDVLLKRMASDELDKRIEGVRLEFGEIIDDDSAMYIIAGDRGDLKGSLRRIEELKEGEWASLEGEVSNTGHSGTGKTVAWFNLDDGTGAIRCVLWRADLFEKVRTGGIVDGDRLRLVNARIRNGSGLEAHVDSKGFVECLPQEFDEISTLEEGGFVSIKGVVSNVSSPREFTRRDGTVGAFASFTLFDGTADIRVVLWDDQTKNTSWLEVGLDVKARSLLVKKRSGRLEAHTTRKTAITGAS